MTVERNLNVFLLVIVASLGTSAEAATFYVRADGTAESKSATVGCSFPASAMNISTYENQTYSPGDHIVFCHEGGVFRSAIYLGPSGTSDAPITYDGRGTAVMSAADIMTGWERAGTNLYSASLGVMPQQVFIDGTFGNRKSSVAELGKDHDWFWASNVLYLYSAGGHPSLIYSNPGVEASVRDVGLGFGDQGYVVIEGITARHANVSGFKGWNPGSHVTLRNCIAEWNWHLGIGVNGETIYSHLRLEDNVVRFNGTGGIGFFGPGRLSTISGNECYSNGKYQSAETTFETQHGWTFGIKLWEYTSAQEGNQVFFNECYDNGRVNSGDYQGKGVGIWLDGVPGNPSSPTIVRHNFVHNNRGNGIFIEISSNTVVLGNVLHENATNTGGAVEFAPANIAIDARISWTSENNFIFNNTSVGGRYGIKIVTYDWQGCTVNNNIVRNNIFVGATEHNLFALFGGNNDGVNGIGNVYEYNNFGNESPGFIRWGWVEYAAYEDWDEAYGEPAHSIAGDPEFVDAPNGSLYITDNSPCRDAGVNLGPPYDAGLLESSWWTEEVELSDQDSNGNRWEVGAYCYSGSPGVAFADGFENGTTSKWALTLPESN